MSTTLLLFLIGFPLLWLCVLSAITYYDATRIGMDGPRKWALIVLLIPLFGLFAYLFERSERSYDPETDPYAQGTYNFHPSRADEERDE